MEILKYRSKYKKEWDEFLKRTGIGDITFTTDFLEIIESEYKYKPLHHIAFKDGEVVGIFPAFLVKGLFGDKRIISLPFSERGGIICIEGYEEQILGHFIESIDLDDVQYIEIRAPVVKNCLGKFGFQENPNYNYCTFLIDLTKPLDEIWKNMDKGSVRWGIKKAMKSGLDVVEIDTPNKLREFYNLYLKTMKYHGSPPHSFNYFKKLFRTFKLGSIRVTLATHEGIYVGGMLCFIYNKKIHYSFGVSRTEHIGLNPNNLLIWDAIQWGKNRGCEVFDFGRTRRGSGVYHFKRRWGGTEENLPHYVKLCNSSEMPYVDPSNKKYRLMIKLWSKLPITLSKALGPFVRRKIA